MASCHPSCTSDLYLLLEVQCQHSYVSYHYTRLTWVINLAASFFTKLSRPAALLAGSKVHAGDVSARTICGKYIEQPDTRISPFPFPTITDAGVGSYTEPLTIPTTRAPQTLYER